MKTSRIAAVFMLVSIFSAGVALAHKVNLFAYVEGGKIHTESYFPDGRMVEGGTVRVFDSADTLLLEGTTDTGGLFSFPIPKVDDLTIVIDAGMGHKNSFQLKRTEVEARK
ncbi:MAG: carboxypeptidase regulatory-like domain-containing protein [Desulfococcus multivorans]|jgi:nickel transport protein|uniref:carboxypeptidase regulatory-like domain-containing protein n=1 Tax=Desulfococcus sp. TaxID=2025834 RepID=UPI002A396C72|nr:carboxypeptidase regulatory-like domain-containing protein [Desulfococcus multivorans]